MTVITAEGVAERRVVAERATLAIHVCALGASAEEASEQASIHVSALAERALAERDAGTAMGHEVSPVTVHARQVGHDDRTEYVANAVVNLTVQRLALVGPLAAEFTRAGHTVATSWALTDKTRRALERDARIAAVADARARAEDYAAALPATIVETLEISDSSGAPMMFAAARGAPHGSTAQDAAAAAVTIPEETVRASVTCRFEARPATS